MTKNPASYRMTRLNGVKFAIHVEGPMPCVGAAKCKHLYCEDAYIAPLDGSPCPFEVEYARRLEAEFRERWDLLTITPDVDDFEALVREHVNIYLQRGRAMARMNRGWDRRADNGRLRADAYREFDLADLYLRRLSCREDHLREKLDAGIQRMRERVERIGPGLQAIEMLVEGWRHAAEEAEHPLRPSWDEFVDGSNEPESEQTLSPHFNAPTRRYAADAAAHQPLPSVS